MDYSQYAANVFALSAIAAVVYNLLGLDIDEMPPYMEVAAAMFAVMLVLSFID